MAKRVVILASPGFLRRERALLSRLEIGLAAEGVRVVHAVPCEDEVPDAGLYSTMVPYAARGLRFTRADRVQRLVDELAEVFDGESTDVDIVHCFGASTWAIGFELARQTHACVAAEVWSASLAKQTRSLGRMRGPATPATVLVPDQAMRRLLGRTVAGGNLRIAKWGVHCADEPTGTLGEGQAVGMMLLASGEDQEAIGACLDGLAASIESHPDVMLFIDAAIPGHSVIWKRLRKLDLLDHVSFVPNLEGGRGPTLAASVVLQPEACGFHHSLTLDAMGAGRVVLATPDPLVEALIDGRTVREVPAPTKDAWASAIGVVLDDPGSARALGASAMSYVHEERNASDHLASVLEAYDEMARRASSASE